MTHPDWNAPGGEPAYLLAQAERQRAHDLRVIRGAIEAAELPPVRLTSQRTARLVAGFRAAMREAAELAAKSPSVEGRLARTACGDCTCDGECPS